MQSCIGLGARYSRMCLHFSLTGTWNWPQNSRWGAETSQDVTSADLLARHKSKKQPACHRTISLGRHSIDRNAVVPISDQKHGQCWYCTGQTPTGPERTYWCSAPGLELHRDWIRIRKQSLE